jgi:hypothetical protein
VVLSDELLTSDVREAGDRTEAMGISLGWSQISGQNSALA